MRNNLKIILLLGNRYLNVFNFYCLQFKCFILILLGFFIKPFLKYYHKKNIWVIGENFGECLRDNGYCFFKYCYDNQLNRMIYFVTKKNSQKKDEYLSSNINVLTYGSLRHIFYLLFSNVFIYSHTHRDIIFNRLFPFVSKNKKLVFLQHGVTGFKKFSPDYQKHSNEPDIVIVVSDFERSIFANYIGTDLNKIRVTGFARYDYLTDNIASQPEKQICYMPTFRDWIKTTNILESKFYLHVSELINDDLLSDILRRNNVMIKFYLHKNMKDYLLLFKNNNVQIKFIEFGLESVQQMIKESHLLITDYSSVSWDFFYLGKPVIFYQFDSDDYLRNRGCYLDLEKDIFGDRSTNKSALIEFIKYYIYNNFTEKSEFTIKRPDLFKYNDKHNCERIYKEISELRS